MAREERYPELDALRGAAVVLMVLYHLAFDLTYFYGWGIPVYSGVLWVIARTSATMFLLLVGLCFVISWHRASIRPASVSRPTQHDNKKSFLALYSKYLRRGLIILSGGMLVSLATWLIVPHAFVKFGILHLIGVAALLQPLFTPFKTWNVFLGILVLLVFLVLPTETPSPFLFPLGITYPGFASLDYYPLLPWYGVILIGMALGNLLYVPTRRDTLVRLGRLPYPHSLLATGKYSLWIYLVHQPLLLLLFGLIFGMPAQG